MVAGDFYEKEDASVSDHFVRMSSAEPGRWVNRLLRVSSESIRFCGSHDVA